MSMQTEFFGLQLTREQLMEIYRALLAQHVALCAVRDESRLEAPVFPPMLEHLERVLGLSEPDAHRIFHESQDALWEYSWLAYTEEWAWFRAQQEVRRTLGVRVRGLGETEVQALAEKLYDERFDAFVAEIDMQDHRDYSEAANGASKRVVGNKKTPRSAGRNR